MKEANNILGYHARQLPLWPTDWPIGLASTINVAVHEVPEHEAQPGGGNFRQDADINDCEAQGRPRPV